MTIVNPIGLMDLGRGWRYRLLYTKSANLADVLLCLELWARPPNWSVGHRTAMLPRAVEILLGYGKSCNASLGSIVSFMSYSCWGLRGGARFCRDHLLRRTAEMVALSKSAASFNSNDV